MKKDTTTKVKAVVVKEAAAASKSQVQLVESLKAVAVAFLIGFILIILTGQANEILEFILSFFSLSLAGTKPLSNFLGKLAYMIPLGLALAVSFRMGLFNIGAAGQAIGGGLAAYMFASTIDVGSFGWIFTLIIGTVVGMLVAMLIAMLKNHFRISEVISSIMINWMVFYILKSFSPGFGETLSIIEGNGLRMEWLSSLFGTSPGFSAINIGIIISIILIPVLAFAYKHTLWGYKQELLGNNPNVGIYLGINKNKEVFKTLALSGALAGLAGTIYFTGTTVNLPANSIQDIPGWSFDGITIALIGFNSPIGVLFSSILIGMLTFPANDLDLIIGGLNIVDIMVAIMIILIARANFKIQYGKDKKPKKIKTLSVKEEDSKLKATKPLNKKKASKKQDKMDKAIQKAVSK